MIRKMQENLQSLTPFNLAAGSFFGTIFISAFFSNYTFSVVGSSIALGILIAAEINAYKQSLEQLKLVGIVIGFWWAFFCTFPGRLVFGDVTGWQRLYYNLASIT